MTVFERIKELSKQQSKTMKQVTLDLNFSENYFYSLKSGKQPSAQNLEKIADYFNVSTDYLLGRTNDKQPLNNSAEQKIDLKTFLEIDSQNAYYGGEKLTQEEKDTIRKILTGLFLETSKEEKQWIILF